MKKAIIHVALCRECPFVVKDGAVLRCGPVYDRVERKQKHIQEPVTIPSWCPLDDVEPIE